MKKILCLVFATIIAITASFGESAFAADTNNKSFTFSNGNVGHSYHWLTYVDTECGMNTIAKYSASSNSNVNKMGVDWTAYNITGTQQDWGNIEYLNKKYLYDNSKTAVLGKSYASFDFLENKQSWKPKGYVYHCGTSAKAATSAKTASLDSSLDLENPNLLPTKYKNLWKSKKGISTKSVQSTTPETDVIKETLDEYYLEDIQEFKLENGEVVTSDSFKVDKTIRQQGSHFEDKELKLEFSDLPEDTNITYIRASVPQNTYQDGEAFNLQAYIVVSDSVGNGDALDFGFISTPVE
ncbi:hypothetical protein ACQKL5_21235 [Peribacillus sp. NPDC097675]|uniref:hypothetical protein n=1 Tax=Peribacillus sp. NPDC097675 TaxID=3390618 RepID=UPI003D057D25